MKLYSQKYTTALLSLCALFTACRDEVSDVTDPNAGKTPIELGMGDVATRAVVIDGHGYITDFEKDTRLHLLMISEDASASPAPSEYTVTYATAKGSGNAPSASTDGTKSDVSFASGDGILRFWDDTHARTSQLSIYGLATANVLQVEGAPYYQKLCGTGTVWANNGYESNAFVGTKTDPSVPWSINPDEKYGTLIGANTTSGKWIIGDNTSGNNYNVQTKTSVMTKDDLCYSNNIADHSNEVDGVDGRMKFNNTLTKQFDHGNMVFHRAMSLFTIKLYAGFGYDPTSSDNFQFTLNANGKPTNIALKGFNKAGYLNIKDGTWSQVETGDWASIDNTDFGAPNLTGSGPYWTLLAFVIPGTDIRNTDKKDAMSFIIDNNYFELSMNDLYNAIKANDNNCESGAVKSSILDEGTKLKAGINYEFSLTIKKTGIDKITAQVIDWETVIADNQTPSNARIQIEVEDDRGEIVEDGIDFYRANDDAPSVSDTYEGYNWMTKYTDDGNKSGSTYDAETNSLSLTETWYWNSSKTYFHFRTVQPAKHEVFKDETNGDYIKLVAAENYTDVKWGAPFKDLSENPLDKFIYNKDTGFDVNRGEGNPHQIYKAIGPTKMTIYIIPIHMMSDLVVKLSTSSGDDKVNLIGAKVNLVGAYPTGKVLMGNGKVIPMGDISSTEEPIEISYISDENYYHYGVIPQDLATTTLEIVTVDDNKYIIDMKDIFVTKEPSTQNIRNPYLPKNGYYYIDRWYPNFKYEYSFKLTKKGIDKFEATIVNWETVEAENDNVQIR